MAQATPFSWYDKEQAVAIPGMKADATVDVVDSFAAEADLNPGDVVVRGTAEGTCKPIAAAGDVGENVKPLGIALHTHKDYDGTGKYYKQGDSVPVMSSGDVYVKAGYSIAAGDAAALEVADGTVSFIPSTKTYTTGMTLADMSFITGGSAGDMVSLRVRK